MEASPPEKEVKTDDRTTGFCGEGDIFFFEPIFPYIYPKRYIIRGLAYVFLCDFRRVWQVCFVSFGNIFPAILEVIDGLETFSYMIYKS